jgi:translocation and assembly module TamB
MRRAFKISVWTLAGAAALLLLLTGSLFIAGNTDNGRAMIENLTRRLTDGHVSLSGLAGSFPRHMVLARLQLSDDRGVWLTADRVTVSWTPLALLAGRIQVESLHAADVDMERLPISSAHPSSEPPSIPPIDVGTLSADVVKLGPELAGQTAILQVHGNFHLRSATDMIIDAAAQRMNGEGDYELKLRFDSRRMDAALKLREPAGGPLENILQLPGLGALAATVNLNGLRTAERLELSVDAGPFHGRAQGVMNLADLSADLDFSVDSPAVAPRSDLSWKRASVHGRWHGSIKEPRADAHVEVDELRLPAGTQLASLNADLNAEAGSATLHAVIAGLRIPGPEPQLLQNSPLTVDASMRLEEATRPLELSASHRLFSLHASAVTTPAAGDQRTAALELRLPNLGELAALGGQNLRGTALVKAQLRSDGAVTHITADAGAELAVGKEIWSASVGDRATLQLSATVSDKSVVVENLRFAGRAVSLAASGELSHDPQTLQVRWSIAASDLKTWSPSLAGTLTGSGTMDGPLTDLSAAANLNSALSVRGSPSGPLSATVTLRDLPSAPSGTLVAQGTLDAAPLHVDVALQRSQAGTVHALIRRVDWKSAHADGDITVSGSTGQSHGHVRMQMARLADLKQLLGLDVAGSVTGNVVLRPEQGKTYANLSLDARDLSAGPFTGSAQLSADGVADALGFKLDLQTPHLYGGAARLSAKGSVNADARVITVAGAAANYHGLDVSLLAPAKIALRNGVSIDELKLGAQQAVLDFKGEVSPALDLEVSLHQVKPGLVNVFVPGLLESGTIEAGAQLQGSAAAPTGRVSVAATDIRLSDDAAFGLPSLDLNATARLLGDSAQIDASLVAGSGSKLAVAGRAPLGADGALDLKIKGALDVGIINPLLEARGQRAAGDLQVDATVAGTMAEPRIGGTMNLAKGSIRDYGRGLSLTDITAAIVGSEGTLQIKNMTATAAPGTVSVTGTVGVMQPKVPVDLKIKADNAQPIVSKLVTANLNAELHVSGTARERLDIAGTVHLNRTLIGIPNSLPPNVAVLDVRRRGKKAVPLAPAKPLVIGLDVSVNAPQQVLVQGRGLDAEVGGDLHVSGTTDEPFVSGGFELQRGTFSLAGSKLNFNAGGGVSFNGAGLKNRIDPTLDFTAQTSIKGGTAKLAISGFADAPQFEFTSTPPLPQDDILALLLFGAPAQQLSGLQLAQIGAALATLSGVGGDTSLNPLVKLQKSLGLDRLSVGAGTTNTATGPENSGASIEAGRYVTKRVYIVAKQSTTGTSQLEADVDLTKHLKLQTRLGNGSSSSVIGVTPDNDPGSSVGLSYQIEY